MSRDRTGGDQQGLSDNGIAQSDQNSSDKSWLDRVDERRGHEAIAGFQAITDSYWESRRTDLRPLSSRLV